MTMLAGKIRLKTVRKVAVTAVLVSLMLYFAPMVMLFYAVTGVIDLLRNDIIDWKLVTRYFTGNGVSVWLLSPLNLAIDLLCYRNRGVYKLEDFPDDYRQEIEEVLGVFTSRKDEIIARIDEELGDGKRGMFLYRWYGLRYNQEIEEFNKPFKYLRTIAVSVFQGKESTTYHFGPLRMTLRILLNLTPVEGAEVYIECGKHKNYWGENPLFIFDDTLLHRSVNEHDARRYCVFMDITRPSPVPKLLSALIVPVSVLARNSKQIFYRHWKMLGV